MGSTSISTEKSPSRTEEAFQSLWQDLKLQSDAWHRRSVSWIWVGRHIYNGSMVRWPVALIMMCVSTCILPDQSLLWQPNQDSLLTPLPVFCFNDFCTQVTPFAHIPCHPPRFVRFANADDASEAIVNMNGLRLVNKTWGGGGAGGLWGSETWIVIWVLKNKIDSQSLNICDLE